MEKAYMFTVTESELNLIGTALGKLPFEAVASVITKLNGQIAEQNKPVDEPDLVK